jgi:hypothetical protein
MYILKLFSNLKLDKIGLASLTAAWLAPDFCRLVRPTAARQSRVDSWPDTFKGTVARDFWPLVFFMNRPQMGP